MKPTSDIARHTRSEPRAPNLSPERLAVERVLNEASEPPGTTTVARRAGVTHSQATVILQRLRADGKAANVSVNRNARWRKGAAKASTPSAAPINNRSMGGTYDGAELRPFDKRPGAMDFKKWPSKGLG